MEGVGGMDGHKSLVIFDQRIPVNLREKVQRTVVRSAVIYGLDNRLR